MDLSMHAAVKMWEERSPLFASLLIPSQETRRTATWCSVAPVRSASCLGRHCCCIDSVDQVGLVTTRCSAAPARFRLQLTKTARALAMVNHLHEKLFAVALAAERQMSEFNVQLLLTRHAYL